MKLNPEVAAVEGGTNVNVAKRRWMIERKVGGIWRRTMRMARETIRKRHEGGAVGGDRVEAGDPRKREKRVAAQKAMAGRVVMRAIQQARRMRPQERSGAEGADGASVPRMGILEMPRSKIMGTQGSQIARHPDRSRPGRKLSG